MVIEIELSGVETRDVEITAEADQVCIRGRHDDLGSFEARFGIPADHSRADARASFANGILRVEVPKNNDALRSRPRAMPIRCNACGKHFDIVVTQRGAQDYRCPACGKVQVFDLEALVRQAMAHGLQMLRRKRGGRSAGRP